MKTWKDSYSLRNIIKIIKPRIRGRARIKQGQQENCTPHFRAEISRKKDYLEYVDVNLRIMLK